MSGVEYAPRGLLGVLTPQANTTVEPEFAALLPPGVGMLNARMTSGKATIVARLLDYLASLDDWAGQFANAPVGAVAFACTGASYYAGVAAEEEAVARITAARGVPFLTAGHAVRDAFRTLGARRIGLVSPYPQDLTEAAIGYFTALGFEVARVSGSVQQDGVFHPIYAMTGEGAHQALTALDPTGLDAVAMLGTGMPTLAPILRTPFLDQFHRDRRGETGPAICSPAFSESPSDSAWLENAPGGVPVLSCMLALAWRGVTLLDGAAPSREALLAWVRGEGWGPRHLARMTATGGAGSPL